MKVGAIQCEKGVEKYIVKIKTNLNDFQLCSRRDVTNDASTPIEASVSLCTKSGKDTTGLSRGISCLLLTESKTKSPDATGLSRGVSRLLLFSAERESPRDEPVASSLYR
jgi:hypothetical protein